MSRKKLKSLLHCPECGSNDLSTKETDRGLTYMTEDVTCGNCGYSWKEKYTLILEEIVLEARSGRMVEDTE